VVTEQRHLVPLHHIGELDVGDTRFDALNDFAAPCNNVGLIHLALSVQFGRLRPPLCYDLGPHNRKVNKPSLDLLKLRNKGLYPLWLNVLNRVEYFRFSCLHTFFLGAITYR